MSRQVKFKDLEIGDYFKCYGDIHLNYNYPKICKCIKIDNKRGKECDGIIFHMNENDEVSTV